MLQEIIDIKLGVLADRGMAHFYEKQEIREIIINEGFEKINIDEDIYTDNQVKVHQYIISAVKKTGK